MKRDVGVFRIDRGIIQYLQKAGAGIGDGDVIREGQQASRAFHINGAARTALDADIGTRVTHCAAVLDRQKSINQQSGHL